jgi:hypothetical protein
MAGMRIMRRMITRIIAIGLLLVLPGCAKRPIDILCPPAGQCPNAPDHVGSDA